MKEKTIFIQNLIERFLKKSLSCNQKYFLFDNNFKIEVNSHINRNRLYTFSQQMILKKKLHLNITDFFLSLISKT